jgi:hypothetical protein
MAVAVDVFIVPHPASQQPHRAAQVIATLVSRWSRLPGQTLTLRKIRKDCRYFAGLRQI